ncbi:MAG: amidase [Microthrixaceae bacterium]|nr:amidase [Microthrixaceae bacterium]
MDLADLDTIGVATAIQTGRLHPREAVEAAIARIEAGNSKVNAVISERFEAALEEADGPLPNGAFRGVPILLKDLTAQMAGEPNYLGNRLLRDIDNRATTDSHVVKRLRRAGFIVLGRTNTPEFGSAPTTEPLAFGPTRNPWNLERSPGGSSGGSAAAVAAGFVTVAHGSDGGGALRIPASCCGLFGLKPSRGRVSKGPQAGEGWGGASTEGCLTRTVRDAAAVLDVLAGPEAGDPYVAPPPGRPFALQMLDEVPRLRIGVMDRAPINHTDPACVAAVGKAADLLANMGHEVESAYPAAFVEGRSSDFYTTLLSVAAAQNLAHWERELGRTFHPHEIEVTNELFASLGREVSGVAYLDALSWVHGWSRRMAQFWAPDTDGGQGFDLLLTPTLTHPPVRIGELVPSAEDPTSAMKSIAHWIAFTPQFNMTGQPAMSVPMHWNDDGLPVGVQIVGPAFGEGLLLALAARLQAATRWDQRRASAT